MGQWSSGSVGGAVAGGWWHWVGGKGEAKAKDAHTLIDCLRYLQLLVRTTPREAPSLD